MLLIQADYKASLNQLRTNGISVIPCILGSETVLLDFDLDQKDKYKKIMKSGEPITCKLYKDMIVKKTGKFSNRDLCDYKLVVEDVYIMRLEENHVLDRELPVYRLDLTYTH